MTRRDAAQQVMLAACSHVVGEADWDALTAFHDLIGYLDSFDRDEFRKDINLIRNALASAQCPAAIRDAALNDAAAHLARSHASSDIDGYQAAATVRELKSKLQQAGKPSGGEGV